MDTVQAPNIVAHITERLLFRRLIDIGVKPEEAINVMAFWMWLEAQGFKDVVRKISSNNDKFLNLVADEASAVLATLFPLSGTPISQNLCPITSIFSGSLSIHDIFGNKETVSEGVADVSSRVCCVVFKDVLEEKGGKVKVGGGEVEGDGDAVSSVGTKLNPNAREWNPAIERVPEEERCLFLTFSKGNPLTENQIFNFFNQKYGPCVERVYVHWPDPKQPALFGKVVFNTCSVPAIIMGRLQQAKFTVNSKPLWCKRFELEKKGLAKTK